MALVSPSVPIHLQEPQMERNQMRPLPRTASVRSTASGRLREIEEEPAESPEIMVEAVPVAAAEEEKVYVALGKEFKEGKATLLWVLQNTDREKKIVITLR